MHARSLPVAITKPAEKVAFSTAFHRNIGIEEELTAAEAALSCAHADIVAGDIIGVQETVCFIHCAGVCPVDGADPRTGAVGVIAVIVRAADIEETAAFAQRDAVVETGLNGLCMSSVL